ncbi:family 1 glycosylhydrolase [Arthrobacter sp. MI7-26]|uniref:glycoside hydrolase family 1 protein n=1 Tax=Arthrobacter sp. MI7-26 TaxID=2993653 RepID=UPI00224927FE|nr:family 1 glycosylhydrolase [Arthrobacter sp. MI7-26]MCX2746832.1 family 1 glycosylhydrolase [Arthrobacter sp. MI7-26]
MSTSFQLPDGFLWGASTAAHQIEGMNVNSDFWAYEHSGLLPERFRETSGDACDSYHRWREDMDLLAELGFTDYRFSIEWARIEPAPGEFSNAAIAHYRRMVEGAIERGLRPMLTLHHFTCPRWFDEQGGWDSEDAVDLFGRFVDAAAPIFATNVKHICTINEPNMVARFATLRKAVLADNDLQQSGSLEPDGATTGALIRAHQRAVQVIRGVTPHIQVGWSVAIPNYFVVDGGEARAAEIASRSRDVFVLASEGDDWIGVQAYTRVFVGPDGELPVPEGAPKTLTGWEYYPPALGESIRSVAQLVPGTPIIVTENGIAESDDTRRIAYTSGALEGMRDAAADGIDIRGYYHWSALDNYEWGSFVPTFGLIAVDRKTFVRTPKPSAAWLGAAGQSRSIELISDDLMSESVV